jgi:NTE family protein
MEKKIPKKIGLALGGGAAKGLAHIGVIRTLEKAGIEISYIAGTSMGALVGGIYAATKDIGFLENFFLKLKEKDVYPASHMIRKRDGVLFKNNLLDLLEEKIDGMNIESCMIPFVAVATGVKNGDEVVLKKGNLHDAIQASTALPLIFPPVEIEEKLLMDGGFVNPVPADVVRGLGAEYVIAVDVSSRWYNLEEESFNPMKLYSVMPRALAIIEYQLARRVLPQADIVLNPPVSGYRWFQFSDAREIIRAGENEARNKLREIFDGTAYTPREKTPAQKFFDFLFYSD